jgi:hypothetical protein
MVVGLAVGLLAGVAVTLLQTGPVRPDIVIAFVVGVPGALGLLLVATANRRWATTAGTFVLSMAPGWFGALVLAQAVNGG